LRTVRGRLPDRGVETQKGIPARTRIIYAGDPCHEHRTKEEALMPMAAILFGLGSAVGFGVADFAGGLVSRRSNSFAVVIWADILAMPIVAGLAYLFGDQFPTLNGVVYSLICGLFGGLGIVLLYQSFAEGKMSIAAPVSALMAGVLPVVVGSIVEGIPSLVVMIGIGLALVSIWVIAREEGNSLQLTWANIRQPLSAGILFGLFFILMHEVSSESVLWPIFLLRFSAVAILYLLAQVFRKPKTLPLREWPFLFTISVLDVAGNVFYMLASRAGRLDVSAVLSSLYPGVTVLLAWIILREHIARRQWSGIFLALVSIILIAA